VTRSNAGPRTTCRLNAVVSQLLGRRRALPVVSLSSASGFALSTPDRAPPIYSPFGLSKNEGQPFPGSRPMCLQLVALLLPARVWVDRGLTTQDVFWKKPTSRFRHVWRMRTSVKKPTTVQGQEKAGASTCPSTSQCAAVCQRLPLGIHSQPVNSSDSS